MGVKKDIGSIASAIGGKTPKDIEAMFADLSGRPAFVAAVELAFAEYASSVPTQERLAGARELTSLLTSLWIPKPPRKKDPAALLPDTQ